MVFFTITTVMMYGIFFLFQNSFSQPWPKDAIEESIDKFREGEYNLLYI